MDKNKGKCVFNEAITEENQVKVRKTEEKRENI